MNLFFTRRIEGKLAIFDEEESRHIGAVLRMKTGELLHFTDGNGRRFGGKIIELSKKKCVATIEVIVESLPAQKHPIHVAIAPTKSMDRFEWFLEKATEIGVSEITPLLCERSERVNLRHDRLEKLMISGMKQSLNLFLPKLNPMTPVEKFMQTPFDSAQKFIATITEGLPHLGAAHLPQHAAVLLIGPEGDFSPKEITLAQSAGFQGVSLGKSRFRTETAGVVSCFLLASKNEE